MTKMTRIGIICGLFTILRISNTLGQSTFIPLNDDYYHLIDRLEIKRGKFSEGFHFNMQPFERRAVVALTDSIAREGSVGLTYIDRSTIEYLRQDSREWITTPKLSMDSTARNLSRVSSINRTPAPKRRTFFDHPADLYSLHTDDVDLHVNFSSNSYIGSENNTNQALWFTGRGVEIRGMINQKLGFYTFVSDNQGIFPMYVRNYVTRYNTPGEGLAKVIGGKGLDFLSARGYITFRPLKSINMQFGHDRNFVGSGYRSMILSDNSSPYLFLRVDMHLGKFQYTNLWTSMINYQNFRGNDLLRAKKFTAMHHLSVNLSERFNIGIFEAEVFSRDSTGGGYDLNYLNPIIFYRFVESYLGSEDNAFLGVNFRWLVAKRASIYGQFMMDEFLTKYYFSNRGSWTKKYGGQLGFKYVDAFGITNLDLQGEYNAARPFTYTHRDGGRNYTHFRQPLAHPLGANFREFLGIIRYKITPRLTAYGTLMWTKQGVDYDGKNWGGNLLLDYETRVSDFGNSIAQGVPLYTRSADLRVSYMLFHNLFLDGRLLTRREDASRYKVPQKTRLSTLALRYNLPYRQQTF